MAELETLEDYKAEAERIIIAVDTTRDGDEEVVVPWWLKLTDKIQWYFDWKTIGWERGVGWYGTNERITIGGEFNG